VAVIRGGLRCLLLLVGVLGFGLSVEAQNFRFDFQPPFQSAPLGQPSAQTPDATSANGYLHSSEGAIESYSFPTYSLSVDPGPHDVAGGPADGFVSCAPAQASSMFLTGPGLQSAPESDIGGEDEKARRVSWKLVFPNFLGDQKRIWLLPLHLTEGQHWKATLAVAGITAGLIALDPHDAPYFRRTNNFLTFHQVFKVTTTERVFLGLPVVWYVSGLATHDAYMQQTAFFAAESLADTDLLLGVMRSVDGRLHPRDITPYGDYTHTWFKAKGTYFNRGSFPSGHAAGAFAVATIFSRRYGERHPWVPVVTYGLATMTGIERITSSAHFPSDVFLGAALAYTISRYVVLREPGAWLRSTLH